MERMQAGLRGTRVYGMITAAVLVGSVGICAAGPAAADSASITLQYTCPFPVIGDQPVTASLAWNPSATRVVVGQATPQLPVNASATVGPIFTQVLGMAGAATVEGTADATAVVGAPQGDLTVTIPLTVPVTAVPASGPMTVAANGTAPSLVFSRPGDAKITVGGLVLHLIVRNASGGLIGEGSGPCALSPGQNDVLTSFPILSAETSPTQPPSAVPGRSTSGTHASASTSASARTTGPATSVSKGQTATTTASGTATASVAGHPGIAATASTSGPDYGEPILVAAGVLAVAAVAFGLFWWLRRRRADGRED
jgi:hypothetical protein